MPTKSLQRLLGKQDGTYPSVALPYWEAIAEARAQTPPLVRPETAGVFLNGLLDRQSETDNRLPIITPLPATEGEALVVAQQMGSEIVADLRRLVELGERLALNAVRPEHPLNVTDDRLAAITRLAVALDRHTDALSALPSPDDALLEAADVQRHIPRGTAWLRANVPSVKVGRARLWKRSAVLEYIATL